MALVDEDLCGVALVHAQRQPTRLLLGEQVLYGSIEFPCRVDVGVPVDEREGVAVVGRELPRSDGFDITIRQPAESNRPCQGSFRLLGTVESHDDA
jgi:hypothetical protein